MDSTVRRVFVSYSSEDESIAEAITDAIETRGMSVFFAKRSIIVGQNYQRAIMRAIRSSQALVLLLSRASMESPDVQREIAQAARLKQPILPFSVEMLRYPDDYPEELDYLFTLIQIVRYEHADQVANAVDSAVPHPTVEPTETDLESAHPGPDAASTWPEGSVERFVGVVKSVVDGADTATAPQFDQLQKLALAIEATWLTEDTCLSFVHAGLDSAGVQPPNAPAPADKTDDREVESIGDSVRWALRELANIENDALAEAIEETIDERIGAEIINSLDDDQLEIALGLQDHAPEQAFIDYVVRHVPDYGDIVQDNIDITIGEVAENCGALADSADPVALWNKLQDPTPQESAEVNEIKVPDLGARGGETEKDPAERAMDFAVESVSGPTADLIQDLGERHVYETYEFMACLNDRSERGTPVHHAILAITETSLRSRGYSTELLDDGYPGRAITLMNKATATLTGPVTDAQRALASASADSDGPVARAFIAALTQSDDPSQAAIGSVLRAIIDLQPPQPSASNRGSNPTPSTGATARTSKVPANPQPAQGQTRQPQRQPQPTSHTTSQAPIRTPSPPATDATPASPPAPAPLSAADRHARDYVETVIRDLTPKVQEMQRLIFGLSESELNEAANHSTYLNPKERAKPVEHLRAAMLRRTINAARKQNHYPPKTALPGTFRTPPGAKVLEKAYFTTSYQVGRLVKHFSTKETQYRPQVQAYVTTQLSATTDPARREILHCFEWLVRSIK